MITDNEKEKNPQTQLHPFNHLKLAHMRLQLNKSRKEHDILIILPKYKTVIQIEVKAVKPTTSEKVQVKETQNAMNQLRSGCEELKRIHGHVLDNEWNFIGLVALPNLTTTEKENICQLKKICPSCRQYVMVGDMKDELSQMFNLEFSEEKSNWEASYTRLIERLATYIHLAPSVSMEKITGESSKVIGGF